VPVVKVPDWHLRHTSELDAALEVPYEPGVQFEHWVWPVMHWTDMDLIVLNKAELPGPSTYPDPGLVKLETIQVFKSTILMAVLVAAT
jgi:hypothetical protein